MATAEVLADRLRAAQSKAASAGYPVALAFPSENGTLATCQATYQLEGYVFPRITQSKTYHVENPGIYFGLTYWEGRGQPDPTSLATGDDFVLDAWNPPQSDPMLIFLPNGKVTSPTPHTNGLYSVVVSRGFQASPSGFGGPGFVLSAAHDPVTITVSQEGSVEIEKGLPQGEGMISVSAIPSDSILPPPPSPPPTVSPELLSHKAYPIPNEPTPGIDAVVVQDGQLTLQAKGWSPQGTPLFAEWSGPGSFSNEGQIPMAWDPVLGEWKAQVDWSPPRGSHVGDQLEISVRINDAYGNANVVVIPPVTTKVVPKIGRVVYRGSASELREVLADGSSDQLLARGSLRAPVWSPDGSKVLAVSGTSLTLAIPGCGVVKTILSETATINSPKWSPDGTRILYSSGNVLYVVDADGANRTNISNLPSNLSLSGGFGWHPRGSRVIFSTIITGNVWSGRTWCVNPDGSNKRQLSNTLTLYAAYSPVLPSGEVNIGFYGYGYPYEGLHVVDEDWSTTPIKLTYNFYTSVNSIWQVGWSHDGKYMSCYGGPSTGPFGMMIVNVEAKSFIVIPSSSAGHTWGVWSPYSDHLLYQEGSSLCIVDAAGGGRKMISSGAYEPDWIK